MRARVTPEASKAPSEEPAPNAPIQRPHKTIYPVKNWGVIVNLVEKGNSWMAAARIVYPDVPENRLAKYLEKLRYHNKNFKKFLVRRGSTMGHLRVNDILTQCADIANFNLADLYQYDDTTGEIKLQDDWLEKAKSKNVLARITVKRRTMKDPRSNVETIVEIVDIVPYSRIAAMTQFCKLKGFYGDTTPGKEKANVTNNTFLVGQINQIRDSMKASKLPEGKLPPLDQKYLEKMVNAEIVKQDVEKDESDEHRDDDEGGD